jgi:two-component system, OmpR family, heavy metal sensor histidine kinase CusS
MAHKAVSIDTIEQFCFTRIEVKTAIDRHPIDDGKIADILKDRTCRREWLYRSHSRGRLLFSQTRFNPVRTPSFRLRIALLSSLLAGSALVGFGVMSWWLIYQAKLNRIDDGLRNQLVREAERPRPQMHWQSHDRMLPRSFNTDLPADLALLVQTPAGETLYQSPTWKAELSRRIVFVPIAAKPPSPEEQPPPDRPPPPDRSVEQFRQPQLEPTTIGNWRVAGVASPYLRMAIGVSLQTIEPEMDGIRNAYLVSIPTLLVSIALGAWWLSGSVL